MLGKIIFCILYLSIGLQGRSYDTYEDEQLIWTPEGNPSLKNKERAEELFDFSSARRVSIIVEAKQVDGYSNIITK